MTTIDMAETISTSLPVFNDVRAWYGPDLAQKTDWISLLDADDIAEIDAAVAQVMSAGLDLAQLRKAQFPLPRLAARLEAIRHSVLHGIGFVLLRGWPSKERTLAQSATAYCGIGAHLGEALSQNNKGHTLGHVTNTGLNYADPTTRGYQTNAELRFHTDAGDMVGLICIRPAKTGWSVEDMQFDHRLERNRQAFTPACPSLDRDLFIHPLERNRCGDKMLFTTCPCSNRMAAE